jgi:hypothetical protein
MCCGTVIAAGIITCTWREERQEGRKRERRIKLTDRERILLLLEMGNKGIRKYGSFVFFCISG